MPESKLDVTSMTRANAPCYIPPGETADVDVPLPTLDDVWDNYKVNKTAIFFFGRIEYFDAFGKPRWATFRMKNLYRHGTGFAYCNTGNAAN